MAVAARGRGGAVRQSDRWVRAPAALTRRMPDRLLVLVPGTEAPVALHGSGPALWDAFARPRTLGEVVEVLAATHCTDPARVARDVAPVVDRLARAGALLQIP